MPYIELNHFPLVFKELRTWVLVIFLCFSPFLSSPPLVFRICLSGCHSQPNGPFFELTKLLHVRADVRTVAILHISLNLPLMDTGKLFHDKNKTCIHLSSVDICSTVNTEKYCKNWYSVLSQKRCIFTYPFCPKRNSAWRKMILLFWENFLFKRFNTVGLRVGKRWPSRLNTFLLGNFVIFLRLEFK